MLSHTTVYHSIRRGNRGKGIVKANRSRIRDKKTMVSTFTIALEVRFDVEENRNTDQNTRWLRDSTPFGAIVHDNCYNELNGNSSLVNTLINVTMIKQNCRWCQHLLRGLILVHFVRSLYTAGPPKQWSDPSDNESSCLSL